jgi:AbrB family looped-hinge helix DNA binding protein
MYSKYLTISTNEEYYLYIGIETKHQSMKEMVTTLKVDTIGRVMIPKHMRDAMGIKPGDLVRITVGKEEMGIMSEQKNPCEAPSLA